MGGVKSRLGYQLPRYDGRPGCPLLPHARRHAVLRRASEVRRPRRCRWLLWLLGWRHGARPLGGGGGRRPRTPRVVRRDRDRAPRHASRRRRHRAPCRRQWRRRPVLTLPTRLVGRCNPQARRRRVGEHAPRRHRRGLSRACAVTAAAATAAADGGGAGACPRPTDEAQGRSCTPVGSTHLDAEGATRDGLGGVGDRDHVPEQVQRCSGAAVQGCRGAAVQVRAATHIPAPPNGTYETR